MQQTDLFCGICRKLASGICGLQSAFFICPYVHLIKIGRIDMVKLYHIDGCQHSNVKNNKQNFITVRNKVDHRSWQDLAGDWCTKGHRVLCQNTGSKDYMYLSKH